MLGLSMPAVPVHPDGLARPEIRQITRKGYICLFVRELIMPII
jgi:hypothetical protein